MTSKYLGTKGKGAKYNIDYVTTGSVFERALSTNRDVTYFTALYKKTIPQNPLSGFCFGYSTREKEGLYFLFPEKDKLTQVKDSNIVSRF